MEISNNIRKIAVIGAGISGLAIANLLNDDFKVTIFEKEDKPGGLIRCESKEGYLFHLTGGHVFNSKHQDVLKWFWNFFDRDKEFVKTPRNASIALGSQFVGYPIENHLYMLPPDTCRQVISDLLDIFGKKKIKNISNFEDFLKNYFGDTLYRIYFQPYNKKIWRQDLKKIPISWLEGKLPMPSIEDIFLNNIHHIKEDNMVHSSFWYALNNGSQFIANRLAEKIDIRYNQNISKINYSQNGWLIGDEYFNHIIFCGNLKQLPSLLQGVELNGYTQQIEELHFHGTTSVLCEIKKNPYSWIYLPDQEHLSHRIICTGNFSTTNNPDKKNSAIIEFTDNISQDDILDNLQKIPLSPKYIAHHYTPYTYPIQGKSTRNLIQSLKNKLRKYNFFLLGRFAEWEYYNMDAAIASAMSLNDIFRSK